MKSVARGGDVLPSVPKRHQIAARAGGLDRRTCGTRTNTSTKGLIEPIRAALLPTAWRFSHHHQIANDPISRDANNRQHPQRKYGAPDLVHAVLYTAFNADLVDLFCHRADSSAHIWQRARPHPRAIPRSRLRYGSASNLAMPIRTQLGHH